MILSIDEKYLHSEVVQDEKETNEDDNEFYKEKQGLGLKQPSQ